LCFFRSFDFVGTIVSVFFNYAGPFFLKRIIDAIDSGDRGARARAYLFAILMFASQVAKSEADLQHLWYGRRATVRVRSQLMSAIYDKALKRRDYSGIVQKDKEGDNKKAQDKKNENGKKGKEADESAAGADVGKIVNLMAGDTQRIAMVRIQFVVCDLF
jgi:ABC-type multidrug transport system fused ATPase/permease subunit